MQFPYTRLRRLRRTQTLRALIRENQLSGLDLIYPLFIEEERSDPLEIKSMPGIWRHSSQSIQQDVAEAYQLGIRAIILFGIPATKDERASEAHNPDGIIQRTVRELKSCFPDLCIITDVCLCEYMSHGHCGLIDGDEIQNDASLDLLVRTALSHAEAGADIVAPSDMMDGRVQAMRKILDTSGYHQLPIMSYAVKYASAFYGPFREAADSAPSFGDRRSYQMDPANAREALREAALDVQEGADILMVKPALPYLDILGKLRERYEHPLAAYQVSGEYAMLKAAARQGWLDEKNTVLESLTSIKRAGADLIVSYYAKEVMQWLGA